MEALAWLGSWLWWLAATLLSIGASLLWLLVGGWVSTLLQIALLVLVIFAFKYGWRRAPLEMADRGRWAVGWLLGWLRSGESRGRAHDRRDPIATRSSGREATRARGRPAPRRQSRRRIGLSTLFSLMALGGLAMLALLG